MSDSFPSQEMIDATRKAFLSQNENEARLLLKTLAKEVLKSEDIRPIKRPQCLSEPYFYSSVLVARLGFVLGIVLFSIVIFVWKSAGFIIAIFMFFIILFPFLKKYFQSSLAYVSFEKIRKKAYSFLGRVPEFPGYTEEEMKHYESNQCIEELALRFSGRGENIVAFCQSLENTKLLDRSPGFYTALALAQNGKKVLYLDLRKKKKAPPEFLEPKGGDSFDKYLAGDALPHSLILASKYSDLYVCKRSEECPFLSEPKSALRLEVLMEYCLRHYDMTFIDMEMEAAASVQALIQYPRTLAVPCLAETQIEKELRLVENWKKRFKIRCSEVLVLGEKTHV